MPQRIDATQVQHIALLARLNLGAADVARYSAEMSRIIEYFGQLAAVDTSGVEAPAHPLPVHTVWADDVPGESVSADVALHNAPQRHSGFFAVPKILEGGEG